MLGILVLFVLVMLLAPLKVGLHYRRTGSEDDLCLVLGIAGVGIWELKVESIVTHRAIQVSVSDVCSMIKQYRSLVDIVIAGVRRPPRWQTPLTESNRPVRFFLALAHLAADCCSDISWTTRVGTGSPAGTGMVAGALWAFKHTLASILKKQLHPVCRNIRLQVIPDYDQVKLDLDFLCIFRLSFGHIIVAGVRNLLSKLGWKGMKSFG